MPRETDTDGGGANPAADASPPAGTPEAGCTVRRLVPTDAEAYRTLMLEAFARHPDAFTSTAAERARLPIDWWRARLEPRSHEVLFGACVAGRLAGAVGLAFEQRARTRHKVLLFGMYVAPEHRSRGCGSRLLDAALEQARAAPGVELVQLTVTEHNRAALALYRSRGFVEWGLEPRAVTLGDGHAAKLHLWCDLRP
jgi:ribosomal protein S18 acetylase RimI-like enzyme